MRESIKRKQKAKRKQKVEKMIIKKTNSQIYCKFGGGSYGFKKMHQQVVHPASVIVIHRFSNFVQNNVVHCALELVFKSFIVNVL